jgi:hypothetical protein
MLGPAVVLVSDQATGWPTSSDCSVVFDDSVVDKDHEQVCAPPGGDITAACDPGDTSLVTFRSEPLRIQTTNPADDAQSVPLLSDPDVCPTADPCARMVATLNTIIAGTPDPGAAVLEDEGGNPVAVTTRRNPEIPSQLEVFVTGGFTASTTYTLEYTTALTDAFGVALPDDQTRTITFTTATPAL